MFCRNCANQLDDAAAVCVRCGAPRGQGVSYCPNCAAPSAPGAVVCVNCGVALAQPVMGQQKSKMAAGLLGIFLGSFGVHNFYLGFTSRGIIQLVLTICSCGIAGIWGFIEGILILTGSINKDANGIPLGE